MKDETNLRIGSGDVLRRKLDAATYADVREEYVYRTGRSPVGRSRAQMTDAVVAYVARTGDGPESLKRMLRF